MCCYKTDDSLYLMEPELLASGCPGPSEWGLGVCFSAGEAVEERGAEGSFGTCP